MDYTPYVYYQPADDLEAATPGSIVIDSHEYDYSEDDEIEDDAPTLRSTDRAV